jgi:hypothetical protein
MKNLSSVANDLFQKIRGRFPSVTIGDKDGNITNVPSDARFFDFAFTDSGNELGKVNVSLDEKNGVVVVVGKDLVQGKDEVVQGNWYNFLKELRIFAKKRMMPFDVRDINKSNLNRRDYQFLATNRPGEEPMAESRMYGTNKTSYQRIGNARLAIKHTQPINVESVGSRSQKIGAIYIESPEGERFKYPFRHLAGARAMARHVSEGGNAYDDFGKYVAGLSEEAVKLQKFKTYMGRSTVMAETLAGYMDTVNERIQAVKKEIHHLQKEAYYREAAANFTVQVVEEVPNDVSENWIDQLTIKQFNEELKDVFPYIYKLVGEATKAKELGPDELDESGLQYYTGVKKHGKEYMKRAAQAGREGASQEELGRLKDKYSKAEKKTKEEFELEQAFEDTMGQFSDHVCEDCGNPSWRTLSEEKQKGVDGKVCWKGYKRMGTKMKGGKRVDNCVKVSEAEDDNFTADDLRQLQKMNNVDDVKRRAIELITTKSRRPMKPEKVAWFKRTIASKRTPMDVIKLMYDLMLSGDGNAVIGSKGSMASNSYRRTFGEAYINTNKDAISVLGNLRKISKSIELGQSSYEGNLAGEYANDVWEVYNFIEAKTKGFQNIDNNAKDAIKAMMELRKVAKGLEREPGSSSNAQFANQIVNTLYPVMQYLDSIRDEAETEYSPPTDSTMSPMSMTPKKPEIPLSEFILSYFDRESGKFPKGETAVLTAVQKDYGDQFVKPAAQFMKKIESTVMAKQAEELQNSPYPQMEIIKKLAGY